MLLFEKQQISWLSSTRIPLFQPSEQRKSQCRESKGQFMPNVGPFPNQTSDWCHIPSNLHSQCSSQKSKAKCGDSAPTKRKQSRFIPGVKVVCAPTSTPEEDVFFCDHNQVDDCPVANDAQECLKRIFEVLSSTAPNSHRSYETKRDQHNSGNSYCRWSEVLGVKSKGIVIGNIILECVSLLVQISLYKGLPESKSSLPPPSGICRSLQQVQAPS